MRNKTLSVAARLAVVGLGLSLLSAAYGDVVFYSGDLRTNATFASCGPSCSLVTDADYAQWAGVQINFSLVNPATITATTLSFGGGTSASPAHTVVPAGGFEPYLSLFDSGGNFLASTYLGTTCPAGAGSVLGSCFDVQLTSGPLAAGNYSLLVTAYANQSHAENLGTGTLADGLTGLGALNGSENLNYALDLDRGVQPAVTPEPGSFALFLIGGAAILIGRRRR